MEISEKLVQYHAIYCELFKDPFMSLPEIAENTTISEDVVSHLLNDMYSDLILKGPMVFLKPAENYPLYATFLTVKDPYTVFEGFKGSHILATAMGHGDWNVMVISKTKIDLTKISGLKKCVYQGKKGVTFFSRVTLLEWEQRITTIQKEMRTPDKKTSVLETIPVIPWGNKEWELFERFKFNVRITSDTKDVPETYTEWISQLPEYAVIQPGFFPEGVYKYDICDYLFRSQYQKQLVDILGMLPSTSVFFSTGEYVMARLFFLCDYAENVVDIVSQLGEFNYFTEVLMTLTLHTG
ncbi:MAG: hypothetical protein PVF58_22595 [Candidatus Methanofastidiosia archaeon]|jgi:hypothetical protein